MVYCKIVGWRIDANESHALIQIPFITVILIKTPRRTPRVLVIAYIYLRQVLLLLFHFNCSIDKHMKCHSYGQTFGGCEAICRNLSTVEWVTSKSPDSKYELFSWFSKTNYNWIFIESNILTKLSNSFIGA